MTTKIASLIAYSPTVPMTWYVRLDGSKIRDTYTISSSKTWVEVIPQSAKRGSVIWVTNNRHTGGALDQAAILHGFYVLGRRIIR